MDFVNVKGLVWDSFMVESVFFVSILSMLSIFLASALCWNNEKFDFFPPPHKQSWQYRVFWMLFRIMFIGLVMLSFLDFNAEPLLGSIDRYGVWLPLMIIGFGGATYFSAKLGWDNAHGEKGGLVTSGAYRWSRNPIYVSSLVGMLGWGLFVNSYYVSMILALWALLYIAAPFFEESWLERAYGPDFVEYKNSTPRFLGFPRNMPK